MEALKVGLVSLLALGGAGWAGISVVAAQNRAVQETVALRRVREWLVAVNEHRPGQRDAALVQIQAWTDARLRILQADLASFLRTPDPPLQASFVKLDVPEERARILRRGAMLHADAAMLMPVSAPAAGTRPPEWATGVLIHDGQPGQFTTNSFHWAIGHLLLHALPARSSDPFVDLWYRATTAVILADSDYATIESHLARARVLLADRAHVWLVSGVVHAYYASPSVQRASSQITLPRGATMLVQNERAELDRAEQDLRRGLRLEPDNVEGRLRLGRVLGLKQRPQEALTELRAALGAATDPIEQYYALLFSGQIDAALEQPDAARASFERAAALFPAAQAPRLALSELAAIQGDRVAARAALRDLSPRADQSDPWWSYDISYARDWAVLVARLRAWFSTEQR